MYTSKKLNYLALAAIILLLSLLMGCPTGDGGSGSSDAGTATGDTSGGGSGDTTSDDDDDGDNDSIDQDGDGYTIEDGDCDDTDATIHPDATDIPDDRIDQDCDGYDLAFFYGDSDGDGYGNPSDEVTANTQPDGYVTDSTDCDDNDASIYPGAAEIPDDGIDQSCNGFDLTTYYQDSDADTYGDAAVSLKADTAQPDGYVPDGTDCDDTDASINPGAFDTPSDGIDQDCDGFDNTDCTILVPGHYDKIQLAIENAVDGCLILVSDGTYVENINFLGKKVTLRSVNGAENTIIDGNANGSVVTFINNETNGSILDGFTITNGTGTSWDSLVALAAKSGNDSIIFEDHTASFEAFRTLFIDLNESIASSVSFASTSSSMLGGGIICYKSSPIIRNCIITNNLLTSSGGNGGGGIYADKPASLKIENCNISSNTISGPGGGGGIGINLAFMTEFDIDITDCQIKNNSVVGSGGGISSGISSSTGEPDPESKVTITGCEISGNTAKRGTQGGAGGGLSGSGRIIISDTIFSNNSSRLGGALAFRSVYSDTYQNATITNSVFNSNSADLIGGAIDAIGYVILVNCTIADNFVTGDNANEGQGYGGGIAAHSLNMKNSIVSLNTSVNGSPQIDVTYSSITTCFIGGDPKFVSVEDKDYRLLMGSPCIDTGTDEGAPLFDILGVSRPQGLGFDMGSYEGAVIP
jgi:hypothetical protein